MAKYGNGASSVPVINTQREIAVIIVHDVGDSISWTLVESGPSTLPVHIVEKPVTSHLCVSRTMKWRNKRKRGRDRRTSQNLLNRTDDNGRRTTTSKNKETAEKARGSVDSGAEVHAGMVMTVFSHTQVQEGQSHVQRELAEARVMREATHLETTETAQVEICMETETTEVQGTDMDGETKGIIRVKMDRHEMVDTVATTETRSTNSKAVIHIVGQSPKGHIRHMEDRMQFTLTEGHICHNLPPHHHQNHLHAPRALEPDPGTKRPREDFREMMKMFNKREQDTDKMMQICESALKMGMRKKKKKKARADDNSDSSD